MRIYVGFDRREAAAFAVAKHSIQRHLTGPIAVQAIELTALRARGLYTRKTTRETVAGAGSVLWDAISNAPMSTEFAISRFLTPLLAGFEGWALFMDSDVLVRGNLMRLFDLADRTKAVQVVKHDLGDDFGPGHPTTKMDDQIQLSYPRKNWSSVMLFNCAHPANQQLSAAEVNRRRGLDLHMFSWLDNSDIGELPPEWNWLVGHSPPVVDPQIVHFTDGFPLMPGYEKQPYADEWERELRLWAAAG